METSKDGVKMSHNEKSKLEDDLFIVGYNVAIDDIKKEIDFLDIHFEDDKDLLKFIESFKKNKECKSDI